MPTRPLRIDRASVVMFDLDGTLVDTMPAFADLAAEVMASHHGDVASVARSRYLQTSGIPFCQQLEVMHPGHPANPAASAEFERRKLVAAETTAMDADTRAGLAALRALGLRLVVSSNTGQAVVDDVVAREGVGFDLALGFAPERGLAKGEPHVAQVCAALGVERADIVFVGDSLKDGELARAAGLAFVGRLGTFTAADFDRAAAGTRTIAAIGELAALLRTATVAA